MSESQADSNSDLLDRTEQETFGNVSVNQYSGDRRCDSITGIDEDGNPERCKNTAGLTILRRGGIAEFYCGIHTKDVWDEMAMKNAVEE